MGSLSELLNDADKKKVIVDDCLVLLDEEVGDKRGVTGMAIKAGYKTVKGVKPGFLRNAVNDLLPDFAKAIDPFNDEAREKGVPVSGHLLDNSERVADALLAITDARAAKAETRIVKAAYDKLRGMAKKNVQAAVPRLSTLIEKHVMS